MDVLVERYLRKIGLEPSAIAEFATALFKDYDHNKSSNTFQAQFLLDQPVSHKAYARLFAAQEKFVAQGGFLSRLTFVYQRIDDSAVEELLREFAEDEGIFELDDYYFEERKLYFAVAPDNTDAAEAVGLFQNFLRQIDAGYLVYSCVKVEEEPAEPAEPEPESAAALSPSYDDPLAALLGGEVDELSAFEDSLSEYENHYREAASRSAEQSRLEKENYLQRQQEAAVFHPIKLIDFGKVERVSIAKAKIFNIDIRDNRKWAFFSLFVYDGTSSVEAVIKVNKERDPEKLDQLSARYRVGQNISFKGRREEYRAKNQREDAKGHVTLAIQGVPKILPDDDPVLDEAPVKRVELHLHTKMSALDGVSEIGDYIALAASWGHRAIGLTDHGGVQSFPAAQAAAKKKGLKMLYGAELYVVDEALENVFNPADIRLRDAEYLVFDLETTGLSARYDRIIEFGAVKMRGGLVEDEIDFFVNPDLELSSITTNLTGITGEMVRAGVGIRQALASIVELVKGCILVSHNAAFDVGFINEALKNNGMPPLDNPVIDTLPLSRYLFPKQRSHTLGSVARTLDVEYDESSAHRAIYDAQVLKDVYEGMLAILSTDNYDIRHCELEHLTSKEVVFNARPFHVTAYAKNSQGLKDLFEIISISNIEYLNTNPLVPRSLLESKRANLLLGSACLNGEVFQASMTRAEEIVQRKMDFYDFIEVQPPACYSCLINDGQISSEEHLEKIISDTIKAAQDLGKMVVATGDVHYLRPEQKMFRDVYIFAKGIKGARHPLNPYRRDQARSYQNPDQHLLTTAEMEAAFAFLNDSELIHEIVVVNSNRIADMFAEVNPIKDKLYTPTIDNCAENLERMVWETARERYARNGEIPAEVSERLNAELKGIRENNYFVIYYIASQLVTKTNEAGYLVGSRGSVGSSLIATMAKITEVNPLPPHYCCPRCHHLIWADVNQYRSGFDLPALDCPECGTPMRRDGQNIPFATFLGFRAEKVPDIDLNFPSNFQQQAHEMTKELLGADNVYKAGTIETIADKTAIGYVKGYFEHENIDPETIPQAEIMRLANGCMDVKKTTGQHPGGIIVIPRDMSVYDFTPIQYPANAVDANWKTTHFDFHAIHDNVLKLDLLGHVDPYAVKMMSDMTGVDIYQIPFDDPEVIGLFSSTRTVGFKYSLPMSASEYEQEVGTLGIPEFGTDFARRMLNDTKPRCFADLLIISGLSHGTDVYNGNADLLIKEKKATLQEVIGCRDDIMTGLHDRYGIDYSDSFKIMELVRKNNFTKPAFAEQRKYYEKLMRDHGVPEYYIESCCKIKYLFPKAHAVAYCMMGIRVGWFKVHRPLAYYATFFTVRCDQYDLEAMIGGMIPILKALKDLDKNGRFQLDAKGKSLYTTLTTALEMARRGIRISKISLSNSLATTFKIDESKNVLIPPFNLVPGLGASVAESIEEARSTHVFSSEEDLLERTRLGSSKLNEIKTLYRGIFDMEDLPESDQLTLF